MRGWALLALFAAGSVSAPVWAQDRPAALPTRDVDVTYRIEGAGQVIEQRSRFTAAAQRMRVDLPTPGVYTIMDYRTHSMSFVVEADRSALDTAAPGPAVPGSAAAGSGTAYVRRGEAQVAGLGCTEWETRDTQNHAVLTCYTADGVMLRARTEARALAVATRVAYGPMDPALFSVPAGFQRMTKAPGR